MSQAAPGADSALPQGSIATRPEPSPKRPNPFQPRRQAAAMLKRLVAFATVLVSLILLGMVAGR
ncbi:hypothetical protein DRQ53_00580 [bacterium]|nr:MAG: hypothetical protein DRQ32_02240 [bacterium]RKZ18384.1 MAG: hypothetical protein DRQ53_00580 [bacterium]